MEQPQQNLKRTRQIKLFRTYGSNQTVIGHVGMVVDLDTNGDYIEFYASHNHGDNRGTNTGGVTNATIFKIIGN